ncbi:MAG: helix-turn-helix domain-containing protein [Pseudomonadales bacterium]|nr:helix-turn-helix domain-containing protein [Pseudomonadales bacterium]MBO6594604.1 helix-turn-helix domain-containing protein [Pseudomonadales bacterium]MBO6821835.1 helix-turn-helix domain-containing protein [Pseudomonadales bacterium]
MKRTTPDQTMRVVTLRAAGWPLSVICADVDLSLSTVQRILKRNKTKRGELQEKMIKAAKEELSNSCTNDESLKDYFKEMLIESVIQARFARQKALQALEAMNPKSIEEAALTMRAIAAHATASKAYSDNLRQMLPGTEPAEELPEFVIKLMTQSDMEELRLEQEREKTEFLEAPAISDIVENG